MQNKANDGKSLSILVDGVEYNRYPIKTKTIMPDDKLEAIVDEYVANIELIDGDVLFITEKIVSITQGRSFFLTDIKPSKLAHFLSKHVVKKPAGIGLGMPETMHMALAECGVLRILFAAAVSVVSKKVLRRTGDFYRIAGSKARAIDGPTAGTLPPYDRCVVLGPAKPNLIATQVKAQLDDKVDVLVVDINDLGGNILGSTLPKSENKKWVKILRDNPLGQGEEATPMGVLRKA